MVELPEPDYYTLEEVAQRWGTSEDVLLRLGAENKIKYGYHADDPFEAELRYVPTPRKPFRFPLFSISQQEAEALGWPSTKAIISGLFYLDSYMIKRFVYEGEAQYLGVIRFYGKPAAFIEPNGPRVYIIPPGTHLVAIQQLVRKSDIVIPTTEIHRIEHQHEIAKQAAADDVLGGSAINSRRILLTMIGALCSKAAIDPRGRGATTEIKRLLELQGTPASEHTIRDAIKEIPAAMQARKTANGK